MTYSIEDKFVYAWLYFNITLTMEQAGKSQHSLMTATFISTKRLTIEAMPSLSNEKIGQITERRTK